jgi:hypothetical protein
MNTDPNGLAFLPAQWVKFFQRAGILGDALARATTDKARAIVVGKYLSARVGRTIPVCVVGRAGKATLRVIDGRAREKRYWIEVVWDAGAGDGAKTHKPKPGGTVEATHSLNTAVTPPSPRKLVPCVEGGNDEEWED